MDQETQLTCPLVHLELSGSVAHIQLRRPAKRNALTLEMRDALAQIFEQVADDERVRAVLLTGEGAHFCAGADITEMGRGGTAGSQMRARHLQRLMRAVTRLPKPVVCAVSGTAVGMGLSLALACDVLLLGRSARLGQVQGKIALPPDAGAVWFLARYLGIARAKELVFSGRLIDADEAVRYGLALRSVADEELTPLAMQAADELASGPTIAHGLAKRMFDLSHSLTLDGFLEHESVMVPLSVTASDFREGTTAFLERRTPAFTGK